MILYLNKRKSKLRVFKNTRSLFYIFLGKFVKRGKKQKVFKAFLKALVMLKLEEHITINDILIISLNQLLPTLDLRSRFSSGINYLLPSIIKPHRSLSLGLIWFYKAVEDYPDSLLSSRIYTEFRLLLKGNGSRATDLKDSHYSLIRRNKILLHRFKRFKIK